MTTRLADKDQTIRELDGTVRLAERRADVAEARVKREAKRANDAQARLSDAARRGPCCPDRRQAAAEESPRSGRARHPEAAELPTIVDLLAWEDARRGPPRRRDELDIRRHA